MNTPPRYRRRALTAAILIVGVLIVSWAPATASANEHMLEQQAPFTGRACVFNAPDAADGYGHMGWAVMDAGGNWFSGATEVKANEHKPEAMRIVAEIGLALDNGDGAAVGRERKFAERPAEFAQGREILDRRGPERRIGGRGRRRKTPGADGERGRSASRQCLHCRHQRWRSSRETTRPSGEALLASKA